MSKHSRSRYYKEVLRYKYVPNNLKSLKKNIIESDNKLYNKFLKNQNHTQNIEELKRILENRYRTEPLDVAGILGRKNCEALYEVDTDFEPYKHMFKCGLDKEGWVEIEKNQHYFNVHSDYLRSLRDDNREYFNPLLMLDVCQTENPLYIKSIKCDNNLQGLLQNGDPIRYLDSFKDFFKKLCWGPGRVKEFEAEDVRKSLLLWVTLLRAKNLMLRNIDKKTYDKRTKEIDKIERLINYSSGESQYLSFGCTDFYPPNILYLENKLFIIDQGLRKEVRDVWVRQYGGEEDKIYWMFPQIMIGMMSAYVDDIPEINTNVKNQMEYLGKDLTHRFEWAFEDVCDDDTSDIISWNRKLSEIAHYLGIAYMSMVKSASLNRTIGESQKKVDSALSYLSDITLY